jgi:hypothetical protein
MIITLHYCTYTPNPCTANPPNMAQTRRARGSPRATGSSLSRPAARRQALSESPAPRSASAQSRCRVAYWLKAAAVRLELQQRLKAATSPPLQPGPGRRRPDHCHAVQLARAAQQAARRSSAELGGGAAAREEET